MPQFPHLVLNEQYQSPIKCPQSGQKSVLEDFLLLGPPPGAPPCEPEHSPWAWGWVAWGVVAPAGSVTGWTSLAGPWALATRFRAELKPGRNPKKLPRICVGRGNVRRAGLQRGGGEHQTALGFHTSSGPCFWTALSFKPLFPHLDNGQIQPPMDRGEGCPSLQGRLPRPPFHRWRNGGSERAAAHPVTQ